jgi:hypothetical protein
MKRTLAPAVALASILGLPLGVTGQSARTDNGVAAFVRGDYARAVELLKPAAERWQMPFDHTAAFFMALMYDNGLGVASDPTKACALTLRTSINPQAAGLALTFAVQAMVEDFNGRLSAEQMGQCMLLADIGFDRTVQQAIFTLAAGHWISINVSSERREVVAHIEYGGKRHDLELDVLPNMAGVRYLPFTVTELTSLRPRPESRHFLEAFVFMPTQANRWTLMWFVFEIVRDKLAGVTFEEVQTVDGEQPPAYSADELRRLARVRVNADGNAEWIVSSGAEPRQDVIETDAERQEIATERRIREAAEKFDPTVRRPRGRAPSLTFADASPGCWDLLAYASSPDRTESISFRLDRQRIQQSARSLAFDIAAEPDVHVRVWVYDSARRSSAVCDDARAPDDWREPWRAVSGTLVLGLSPVFRVREPGTYRATIRLTDAEFVSPTGARVRQSQPITLSTIVRLPQQ